MSGAADRELAVLLSTATRIEPELMRAVRLTAAPRLDVAAETELWFGDLVERRASGHIVLRRDLLPELRQELGRLLATAREDAPVHRVGALVDEAHRAGSPALHAEERAVWHAVRGGPRSERLIEEALLPALRALVDQHRDGVARWFAGAWGRLPEAVRKAKTAWQLATVTAALEGAAGQGVAIRRRPPDGLLLADVGLIAARLPRTELPVLRDGRHLVLGQDAAVSGAFTLSLPDTDPLVLELTLSSGPPSTLLVGRGESATRRVDGRTVRLTVADGSVYEVPAPSAHPAGRAGAGDRVPGPGHVLINYAGHQRAWAVWLAHVLERAGFRASTLCWEADRQDALGEVLEDLMAAGGRVLLVLSDWYFQSANRADEEWSAAFSEVTERHGDRLAAVSVTAGPLPVGATLLEPVDLWGVPEAEAKRRVLRRLGVPATTRDPAATTPGQAPRFPDDPPAVWGGVPRRNARFTGRDTLFPDIHRQLTEAPTGAAVCALLGMSGIGKTALATEYAHRFSGDYDVVWWVDSDTRGALRGGLGELAPELGLAGGPEPGGRIRAVREALRRGEPHRRWLLVFDGWDDMEEAGELLPQGPGHVLITSRNRGWHAAGAGIVEVTGFQRQESVLYLTRRAPRVTPEEADAVAAALDDIPLALAQAAAWLGESGMSVADYLRMVLDGDLSAPAGPDSLGHVPRSALTSWTILINRLRESRPDAVELLSLCTCFGHGSIPVGLVRRFPPGDLPEPLAGVVRGRERWTRALDTLVDYSVLTREPHAPSSEGAGPETDDAVHMHRLVHDIVARLTPPDQRCAYQRVVRGVLAAADPRSPRDATLWPRYAELLPHLESSGALSTAEPDTRPLVLNCLMFTYVSGMYRAGAELADRVRARWEELLPPDDPQMLDLTVRQGNILRAYGRFQAAYELDRAMLRRLRAGSGTDGGDALMSANSCLAADQRFLGQYEEAHRLQREVLRTALALRGPDDYLTLLARHNLGTGLRLLGRYAEAYEADLETLRRRESLMRARHAATLVSGIACARDLRLMGRFREALSRQEQGMRLHVQVLGTGHPQTLRARHNLLLCELRATGGQAVGADMTRLLETMEQVHGRDHYVTLGLVVDYGNHAREQGDLALARDLIAEGESGLRGLLGPAHPVSTGMLSNTGLVLQAAGERAEALTLFEAALAGLTAGLGPDHPWVLGCALNAAAGRHAVGRLEDALDLSRDTLRRARHALGPDHPFTLSCEIALAADLRGLGAREEVRKAEEAALQRLVRTLGAQHPQTLAARLRTRPTWDFEPYLG
ncbi:FxSxx-COOH system tetratricopeptide repeat protein [Streptomyces griseocarneus]|uniref:FxSxx-COOH system tetratricopeptide repeat protein n=1 Tax=Streptomyces griseocarneus TaxID=51201 RepID=UPI00198DF53D|nr:FxSxx-COOH system tetratricopeptide repeat protein [Streptomyces griseocarneus]MBZ6477749.1 tetratricopeptide repeat protein [Streptomyces griseocarneus]GHG61281.1 ATP-binding protein [Streptomyces griseocarneus]